MTTCRFVPVGEISSSDDAPGWGQLPYKQNSQPPFGTLESVDLSQTASHNELLGPVCWKCRGTGRHHWKYTTKQLEALQQRADLNLSNRAKKRYAKMKLIGEDLVKSLCTVCHGKGRQSARKPNFEHTCPLGEITSTRKHDASWTSFGPLPKAICSGAILPNCETCFCAVTSHLQAEQLIKESSSFGKALFVNLATDFVPCSYCIQLHNSVQVDPALIPSWIPRPGEQLCNLVGKWRILQRVGSHRWTTDDIVTAVVASKTIQQKYSLRPQSNETFNYLDLGCGNGSVLSMVIWKLCQILSDHGFSMLAAFGIEARKEAVELNRRSLSFNVCPQENPFLIFQGSPGEDAICNVSVEIFHGDFRESKQNKKLQDKSFHLITGTPPYFRVDFNVETSPMSTNTTAVIRQGGMPTSKQSAPARCEFRGGIEAYCKEAARLLHNDGYFVVCENWANHSRVLQSAVESSLHVLDVQPIKGNTSKKIPLFAIYTMQIIKAEVNLQSPSILLRRPLCVRGQSGKWTTEYANEILEYMSIPALHYADSE